MSVPLSLAPAVVEAELDILRVDTRLRLAGDQGDAGVGVAAGLGAVRGLQPSHLFQIAVSLLVLAVVAIALLAAWRRQPEARRVAVVAAWFYAVAIGMYGTSVLAHPVWVLRYLHYTAPALYLLIGIGIVSLWRWLRPVGLAAGAALLGLTALAGADYYRLPVRENWRIVAAVVAEEAGPEDVVAVFGLTRLFRRYYQGRASVRGIRPHVIWPHSAETAETAQRTEAVLGDLLAQIPSHTGRTWIVVREDPRFQRVAFLERFDEYLRDRGTFARIRIFRAALQDQLDLIDFAPASGHPDDRTPPSGR